MTAEKPRAFTDTPQFKIMRTLVGAANPLVRWLLGSRLAGPLAKNLLLLRYKGRKSGRTFSTPMGYVREGKRVVVVTSPTYTWWRNVVAGADVEVRLDGHWRTARAQLLTPDDPGTTTRWRYTLRAAGPGCSAVSAFRLATMVGFRRKRARPRRPTLTSSGST